MMLIYTAHPDKFNYYYYYKNSSKQTKNVYPFELSISFYFFISSFTFFASFFWSLQIEFLYLISCRFLFLLFIQTIGTTRNFNDTSGKNIFRQKTKANFLKHSCVPNTLLIERVLVHMQNSFTVFFAFAKSNCDLHCILGQ